MPTPEVWCSTNCRDGGWINLAVEGQDSRRFGDTGVSCTAGLLPTNTYWYNLWKDRALADLAILVFPVLLAYYLLAPTGTNSLSSSLSHSAAAQPSMSRISLPRLTGNAAVGYTSRWCSPSGCHSAGDGEVGTETTARKHRNDAMRAIVMKASRWPEITMPR